LSCRPAASSTRAVRWRSTAALPSGQNFPREDRVTSPPVIWANSAGRRLKRSLPT